MPAKAKRSTVRGEVEASVKAAGWIEASDAGAVRLALSLADSLDAIEAVEPETSRDLAELSAKKGYCAQQLERVLRGLGLTPASRSAVAEVDADEDGGRLAAIRSF